MARSLQLLSLVSNCGVIMKETTWQELCEAIMREQEPQKLLMLVNQLNHALDCREHELQQSRTGHSSQE